MSDEREELTAAPRELPEGWAETTLGTACNIIRGITFPASAKEELHTTENVACLRTSSVQREIRWDDVYFVPKNFVKRDEQLVEPGDILMSMANSYDLVGKVAQVKDLPYPAAFGAFLSAVRPSEIANGRLLFNFLRTDDVQAQLREGSSQTTNIANISVGRLSEILLPLPPLAEQVRIADKLDALLARVEAGRERLERVPKLLKRFRQSVLSAAVSGELTREWRGGEDAEWAQIQLRDCAFDFSYGSAAKSLKSGAVPVLRMGNIQSGKLVWDDLVYTSDAAEIGKYELEAGDVLFNRTNSPELVGKTAVYQGEKPAIYAGYLIRVKCSPALLPAYLNYCLNSKEGRDYCWQVKTDGVSQSNINAQKLRDFPLFLPSLDEQTEIIRHVESLFAIADRIEAKYAAALSSFDRLTPALLAKAFRGELVPQDPNDEPASVLLDRIRAAREAEGGKRGRGRPAKAAAGSGDGAEVKRRGRPPGANAQAGAEGAEPKRRGRPPKVREAVSEPAGQPAAVAEAVEASAAPRGRGRPPGPGIPQASSFEDALRKLEEQKLARAQGTRQVGLFDDSE